jgi:PKD repeat protein/ribosomal protein S27E
MFELLYDRDADGYFDDFYFHSYWTEVIITPQGIQIPQSSINVTVRILDAKKTQIVMDYTGNNNSYEIHNLTEGNYYCRMDYKGTRYDFGEFFSYGNGFDNLEPYVEISSPLDNSDYYDNELILFDGTASSDPDYYDRLTFRWYSSLDKFLSSEASFNSSLSPGFHTITLMVDDAHGNVNSTSVGVNITAFATPNTAPVAVISSPTEGASFSDATAVYFDGANSTDEVPENLTFKWSSNVTGTFGGNNSKFSMTLTPGEHQITLMVEDGGGLNSTDIVNITITNSAPVAVIDSPMNGSFFNASDFVWLNASSSYDPDGEDLTYLWSSNISGFLSSNVNQSKRLKSGVHRINLTVTDPNSASDTASVEVTVINRPPVIYDVTPPDDDLTIMEKEETFFGVKFNDTFVDDDLVIELYVDDQLVDFMDAINHDIWLWEQSVNSAGKFYYGYFNFSYKPSYVSEGLHNIKVYAIDQDAFDMVQWNITVQNKNRAPTAVIGSKFVDEITISLDDEIELNGSRSTDDDGDNLTYVWDFDASDGTDQMDDTGPVVMKTFSLPGDFIVTLTVDDGQADNSTGIDNLTVHVNRAPIAVAGPDLTRNVGELIYFNASGSSDPDDNNLTYAWDFGTGDTDVGMNVSYTYDSPGVYTVSLNVTDSFAWDIDTLEVTIKLANLPPNAVAGAIKKLTANLNEAVTFNGSGSTDPDGDILTFTWDFNAADGTDDVDAVGMEVQYTYTAYGEFIVTLTVDDKNGGLDTDNLTVTVNQPPTAVITDVEDGYVGERISFDASDSSDPEKQILSYDWNFGDGTSNVTGREVNHVFMLPDDYTITLTVEDPNGAKDVVTLEITILPIPVPVIIQPSSGTKVFEDVKISGSANGPTVKKVQVSLIYSDGVTKKVLGTVSVSGGAWELTWDSTSVENGDYQIEARSTDDKEEYWSSGSIRISIEIENEESVVDDTPAPTLNETDEGFLDSIDFLGVGTVGVLALCGVGILIIIILIGVMVMRSGSRRKRAPADSLRAAQMDSFRPVADTGAGDVDVEEVDEEEESEPEGTERPIKCPSCGDIFLTRDTGKRPWMLWCTQCGARGIIKGAEHPGLPPGEDDKAKRAKEDHKREKVKCPECTEIFSIWSDDKEIECPNCGISGEK